MAFLDLIYLVFTRLPFEIYCRRHSTSLQLCTLLRVWRLWSTVISPCFSLFFFFQNRNKSNQCLACGNVSFPHLSVDSTTECLWVSAWWRRLCHQRVFTQRRCPTQNTVESLCIAFHFCSVLCLLPQDPLYRLSHPLLAPRR